jgi:hypothetical protein
MSHVWATIRGYIWWTHERGSFHYDVMVTLILLFIFLAPNWVNFNDKPTERNPHQTAIVTVIPDQGDFIYQIDASAVQGGNPTDTRNELMQIIEPIAGEIVLLRYEVVSDHKGRVVSYRAWVRRGY